MNKIILIVVVLGIIGILIITGKNEPSVNDAGGAVTEQTQEVQAVRNTDYQIVSGDTNEFKNTVHLEVLIQEKLTPDEMIAIAHKERAMRGNDSRVHVGFRYFSMNNPYYATACYYVDCSKCEQQDEEGEPIAVRMIYEEPKHPETINTLPVGVDSANVIARFYDHGWGNNALIAYTNKEKTKASYFHLYQDSETREIKLKPLDNMVFKVLDTGAKYQILNDRVEYIQTNGTISYTYEIAK